MTKHTIGKEYRKEGRERARLYTVIKCDICGATTYERRTHRVKTALQSSCKNCKSLRAKQRDLQHQQDRALLAAHSSILRLRPKLDKRLKHGCYSLDARTANIYTCMLARCYNPNTANYEHYGGRGITVCQRWLDDIKTFFTDMGVAPDGYSLERHDINGNYEPMNCSWIPMQQQSRNRRCAYANRGIYDPKGFQKRKVKALSTGAASVDDIPFAHKEVGWWRQFGLYHNPYVYGPMPWKRTSSKHRKSEAIERGWFVPKSPKK